MNRDKSSGVQLVFRFNRFVNSRWVSARLVTAAEYACFASVTACRAVRAFSSVLLVRGSGGLRVSTLGVDLLF